MSEETVSVNEYGASQLGELLRMHREQRGLTIKDVAETLKLTEAVVASIEGAHLDALPSPVFAKGYFISYAKLVGADLGLVDRHLTRAFPKNEATNQHQTGKVARTSSHVRFDDRPINWAPLFLGVSVLLMIAALVWWFYFKPAPSMLLPKQTSDPQVTLSLEQDIAPPPIEVEIREDSVEVSAEADNEATKNLDVTLDVIIEEPVLAQAPLLLQENDTENVLDDEALAVDNISIAEKARLVGQGANELVINFITDCWVQVEDESGSLLVSNSYGAGWELTVRSDETLNVALGYAPGVTVSYNGAPVDFKVRRDSKTARFTL